MFEQYIQSARKAYQSVRWTVSGFDDLIKAFADDIELVDAFDNAVKIMFHLLIMADEKVDRNEIKLFDLIFYEEMSDFDIEMAPMLPDSMINIETVAATFSLFAQVEKVLSGSGEFDQNFDGLSAQLVVSMEALGTAMILIDGHIDLREEHCLKEIIAACRNELQKAGVPTSAPSIQTVEYGGGEARKLTLRSALEESNGFITTMGELAASANNALVTVGLILRPGDTMAAIRVTELRASAQQVNSVMREMLDCNRDLKNNMQERKQVMFILDEERCQELYSRQIKRRVLELRECLADIYCLTSLLLEDVAAVSMHWQEEWEIYNIQGTFSSVISAGEQIHLALERIAPIWNVELESLDPHLHLRGTKMLFGNMELSELFDVM